MQYDLPGSRPRWSWWCKPGPPATYDYVAWLILVFALALCITLIIGSMVISTNDVGKEAPIPQPKPLALPVPL